MYIVYGKVGDSVCNYHWHRDHRVETKKFDSARESSFGRCRMYFFYHEGYYWEAFHIASSSVCLAKNLCGSQQKARP